MLREFTHLPCRCDSLSSFLKASFFSLSLFLFSRRSSSALSLTYFSKTCFRSLDVNRRYLESNTILWSSFSQVLKAETCFSANISLNDLILFSSGTTARSLAARTSASIAASLPMSIFRADCGVVPLVPELTLIQLSFFLY
jgi:hypothetical protein